MNSPSSLDSSAYARARATLLLGYLLAGALPWLTLLCALRLLTHPGAPLSILFILPVALSALIGGCGPGLCASMLSTWLCYFYLQKLVSPWLLSPAATALHLASLALAGLLLSLASEHALATRQQRRRSRQQLDHLVHLIDSTEDAVIATTLDGQISHWNRGAQALYGFSAAQALGRPIHMLFPGHLRESEQMVTDRVIHGERVLCYETQSRRRDGGLCDIATTVSAIKNHHGQLIGIARLSCDISHYQHIERARSMAEEQFRALLEQSLTGVYIVQDDRIVYANHALARLFGYDSAAALQGKVAIELVAPEERSRIISLQAQRQLLEDGALRYRFTGVQRNAQRVVLEVHGRYCLHQGRMAIIGSMSDQSEAQRIQEDLARQVEEKTELLRVREQELQTILDKLPAMISYYDPDLRHRFGNQAYCDWHGVAAGALRGMPLSQVLSPALHQQIQDHLQRIADGKTCIFEQALQHANGQDHWQAQIHLVPDMRAGGLCGLFCLFIDITPIKAAQRAMHESETRFRQLFEAAPVAIGLYHRDGPCMMVNQALADLVGSTRAELQAQNFRRLASWRDSALLACADLALETDQPRHCDVALVSSFGRSLELQCEFSLPEIQGEHYLMLLAKDITPFRQSERLMRQAMADELEKSTLNHKYRLVVENLMDGFLSTDRRGRILDANDVMAALCGYRREALLAMNLSQLHDDSAAQSEQSRLERIVACGSLRFECWMRRQNGAAWPGDISASYSPVEDKIYWFARDITQMKHAEAEVRRLAFFDSLTQLPNRQLLLDRLQQALENSKRSRLHGALLFIDLDNFKQLNDSQGHAMGDLLLTQVATRLLACVRAQDTVARLGGDEFVVMLIDLHPQAAQAMQQTQTIADSILLALNQPYRLGQIDYANTPSIGISLFNDQEISLEALLKQADLAMYQAKAGGRNSSCFHQPEAPDRGQIKTPAPDSPPPLNLEALDLHFAAQFDQQHRLVGCQAVLGERQPAQHASASPAWSAWPGSEAPASPHLMLNMLELACRQLAAWQHDARLAHTPLTLSLNADLFAQDDFVSRLHALLSRHPVPAQRLRLQLPESVLQSSPAQLSTSMTRLSQTGVGFSLSHFGTGPATLAHLESLPLSQLQIAPLYVRDLLHDHNAQAMVRAIVAMGHSLGLAVAADQVSSAEQWDHLRHEGCDLGQGPWFSAPLPAAAFQLAHGVLAQAETAPD